MAGDVLYIVMELLEGTNLYERMRGEPLRLSEVVKVFSQVCDALTAAHHKGVVHRDVKPENIFIESGLRVKLGLGVLWANWLIKNVPDGGKVLEVRGVAGTSVDTDRHNGIHETLDASGKKWDVTEVVGKWDDGVAQKATADAIATNGPFAGITAQGGDTGVVQAMIDAKQAFVPFGGETENGFRKFCAAHAGDGLKCSSAGTGPAQVAVAIKTAIAALEGEIVPQSVKLPLAIVEDPNFKAGEDFFPDQSDNFFVGNAFPTCGINFTAQEIMGQSKENQ